MFINNQTKKNEVSDQKFILSKIWKKKFYSMSYNKIVKGIFNIIISKQTINLWQSIDFKLYIFLLKLKKFDDFLVLTNLFHVQEESKLLRFTGILFQNVKRKFLPFYKHYKWKNDLRLNKVIRFFFEKKNIHLNKFINLTLGFSQIETIFINDEISKKKIKKPNILSVTQTSFSFFGFSLPFFFEMFI
jgi:hypothetical protein